MIAPYTFALHGVMAVLCLISLVYLFYKKSTAASETVNHYFYWFLFFFLYNIFLIAPILLFGGLDFKAGYFYNLALLFLGVGMWHIVNLALIVMGNNKSRGFISALYITGIILAVLLHFIFPEVPKISGDGKWLFWYSNQIVSFVYIIFAFIAGWLFAFNFFKGIFATVPFISKLRSFLLALGAFLLPFAAFYYFGASQLIHIYLAFFFSIIGLLFLSVGNTMGLAKD